MLFKVVTPSDMRRSNVVPPAGFEPALPPPEGGALSPELRGPYVDNPSARPAWIVGAPRWAVIVGGGCPGLNRQQRGTAERDHQRETRAESGRRTPLGRCDGCRRGAAAGRTSALPHPDSAAARRHRASHPAQQV